NNDVDLETDELGRDLGEALLASLAPAVFDGNGATLVPSELAQPLHKGGDPFAACGTRALAQEADDRHLSGLLRAGHERPRDRRAADKRDELAPSPVEHRASRALGDRKGWAPNGRSLRPA